MVEAADSGYLPAQYGLGVPIFRREGCIRKPRDGICLVPNCNNKWQRVYGRSMGFRNEELDGNIHSKI